MNQLKKALLFLYRLKIHPQDVFNFYIYKHQAT
jgi:hypothetical protein